VVEGQIVSGILELRGNRVAFDRQRSSAKKCGFTLLEVPRVIAEILPESLASLF
jgi:hypothetical protein